MCAEGRHTDQTRDMTASSRQDQATDGTQLTHRERRLQLLQRGLQGPNVQGAAKGVAPAGCTQCGVGWQHLSLGVLWCRCAWARGQAHQCRHHTGHAAPSSTLLADLLSKGRAHQGSEQSACAKGWSNPHLISMYGFLSQSCVLCRKYTSFNAT